MKTTAALILSLASIHAFAVDDSAPLSAEIELGLLITDGNTKSNSVYGKAKVGQDLENWKNEYVVKSLYKKDRIAVEIDGEEYEEEQTTAHSFFASIQTDYKLDSKHKSLFVFGSYKDDRFSGFEYQSTLAAGYSDRLLETERSSFDYSVGPGISFTKTEAEYDNDGLLIMESEKEQTGVLHASFSYVFNISDTAKFTQDVTSDIAFESDSNTKTVSETAITATLSKSFAMKASYTLNYNSEVANDKRHADSQTSLTLVYSL